MKLLILVHHRFELWNVPGWFPAKLRNNFPQLEIVALDSYEQAQPHLYDAEIIFTISLRPEQFVAARKLRWIHAPTAAVHQFMFPELVTSDVLLTNSAEVHGPVVAEHVMALLFALAKKIPQALRLQEKRTWGQDAIWSEGPHARELAGSTLGLIGVGSIGRRVALMASALGMRVIAIRAHVNKALPAGVSTVFSPAQLDDLISESDFVVMAAPLTPDTRGMINNARLAKMKPEAYLINVGRGAQVDERALARALCTHQIAGAALDVFEHEPLPSDSPLWGLENLLITPHTAGVSTKLWDRHYELFSENLRRYLEGKALLHVVDQRRA